MARLFWHPLSQIFILPFPAPKKQRLLKNYRLPYHLPGGSGEVVPGHTVSMSSYAGEEEEDKQEQTFLDDLLCRNVFLHFRK